MVLQDANKVLVSFTKFILGSVTLILEKDGVHVDDIHQDEDDPIATLLGTMMLPIKSSNFFSFFL